ncbi:uncharacterized protein METZ01_LOCUS83320 [marine metagenome]|jgi:hypothetical protein|uniref:Cellulose-binding Sde182 nucleoside hydrolase-like domain-containing protein n=1 Tax=marine metagenome TaxID=408172 RepID=A0A381UQN6_9ZZZZ|nr:nucleoside hydrolase-like domain-containing protein [Candidatus Poribacteria bacterium]|tara:strand:- start:514 stop:741 length:228 start_codon:yes stop_codon:yes gene_type:complete
MTNNPWYDFYVTSMNLMLKALVATTSRRLRDKVLPERIQERVEAYELVRNNLLKHALGYPETECLLKVKVQWVRT